LNTEYLDVKKRLSYPCISEEGYAQQMREIVEPYLEKWKQQGKVGDIYYEFYPRQAAKGTIVISHGFTESCEKYHELIYYMHREGYEVGIPDHRGHGNSVREVEDPQIVHVDNFEYYVKDLHSFVRQVVTPNAKNQPLYLFAHSMGGCIGVLYLEQHSGVFKKAVLSAPMLGINNGNVPDWAAKILCGGAAFFGKKKKKLFTMGDFNPDETYRDSGGNSEARHVYYLQRRCENTKLQTSAASYGWAGQALKASKSAIEPKNAARITIPVILFAATDDTFVRPKEQDLFLERIPNGRKIVVESRHEIYRHDNIVLGAYLAEIFEFYAYNCKESR
jgi:lysophospholipase